MAKSYIGARGRVKFFRFDWGFITPEVSHNRRDVFVHYSVIVEGLPGQKTLEEGAEVIFDAVLTEKGYTATKVWSAHPALVSAA